MASNTASKSAGTRVMETFQLTVECGICTNVRELRLLPCQHMMCAPCLNTILKSSNKCCPFCKERLTGDSAQSYPVCRITSELQRDIQQLADALKDYHLTENEENCQSGKCEKLIRRIDMFCTSCLLFICYKCSKKTKCAKTGASHTTEDYEESLVQKYKTKYANWKAQKEKDIQTLKSKQDELVADIQRGVSNLSADNMEQVLENANQQKTECQKVRKRLAEKRMVLSEYSKDIGKVGDKQFIILVSQVCGDSQDEATSIEHSLDTECSVVISQPCYDVTGWEGKMLVGRNDGFVVVDSRVPADTSERGDQSRSHRVLKSVSTADSGHIISIQYYNNQIYTLCKEKKLGAKRQVIVFDSEYREVKRWSVPDFKFISQLAVCNNKVYVSDPDNKQLCVYSATSGKLLSTLSNPLFVKPDHLNICPPHSVLISDWQTNRVHRLDCRSDTITWTSAVVKDPRGIALDHTGREVWVYSYATKSLFILNSDTGEFKQEIHHEKFTQLPDEDILTGICLVDGKLWGAARSSGLLKFTVK